MKKWFRFAMILFTFLGISLNQGEAKPSSSKYNKLVYEGVWFSQLSPKHQRLYLKTVAGLVMKLSSSKVAQLDASFMGYLIPSLEAAGRINNGFIFDGSNDRLDFMRFLDSVNLPGSPLDPGCTPPNQMCAPYLGMSCLDGTARLVCSPNSTPTCAARGSLECLRTTLAGCGMDKKGRPKAGGVRTSPFCQKLDAIMKRGTRGVRAHCSRGIRAAASYCRQAVARLEGVEDPPREAKKPTGADCEQMIRELAQARDRASDQPKEGTKNNNFWRNMTGFAQQACGNSYTRTSKLMGTCALGDSSGPIQIQKVNAYRRPTEGSPNYQEKLAQFKQCVQKKIQKLRNEKAKRLKELKGLEGYRIAKVFEEQERGIQDSARASGECSVSESQDIRDGRGQAVSSELELRSLMGLAGKLRNRKSLTDMEKNQFRAGTGMTVNQFTRSFCNSGNHASFKAALKDQLAYDIRVSGTDSMANLFLGQARVARAKMSRCLANLKSIDGPKGSGCQLYAVSDFNTLRCASPSQPLLAVNRKSRRCVLVTKMERKVTGRRDQPSFKGQTSMPSSWKMNLETRTPRGTLTIDTYPSESFFSKDYQLQEYRCNGDRSMSQGRGATSRCWMKPSREDPIHQGESEAIAQ